MGKFTLSASGLRQKPHGIDMACILVNFYRQLGDTSVYLSWLIDDRALTKWLNVIFKVSLGNIGNSLEETANA